MTHDMETVLSKATYRTFHVRRGSYWTRRHTQVRIKTMHAITVYGSKTIHAISVYLKNYSRCHRISQKLFTLSPYMAQNLFTPSPYISKTIHAITVYLKNYSRCLRISQKLFTLSPWNFRYSKIKEERKVLFELHSSCIVGQIYPYFLQKRKYGYLI